MPYRKLISKEQARNFLEKDDKDVRKFTNPNTAGDQWNTPLKEIVSTAFTNFETSNKWLKIQDNTSLTQSCRNRN